MTAPPRTDPSRWEAVRALERTVPAPLWRQHPRRPRQTAEAFPLVAAGPRSQRERAAAKRKAGRCTGLGGWARWVRR